ncbi:hypothetical protein C2G38_2179838 [Gigaspora rosea]|uniref:Uncharacterized protein n=1 Tax=Gigaspora rosea TaxID=44941 RepID=A0A397VFY5_9GLOM|nr:hypothetical protein C2G38_2179838 [Gigaspora rosea]
MIDLNTPSNKIQEIVHTNLPVIHTLRTSYYVHDTLHTSYYVPDAQIESFSFSKFSKNKRFLPVHNIITKLRSFLLYNIMNIYSKSIIFNIF